MLRRYVEAAVIADAVLAGADRVSICSGAGVSAKPKAPSA
jgi:hypothetical protein